MQIRLLLSTTDVADTLTSAFVLSRLNYCKVIVAGLPKSTSEPPQRAQKAAARHYVFLHMTALLLHFGIYVDFQYNTGLTTDFVSLCTLFIASRVPFCIAEIATSAAESDSLRCYRNSAFLKPRPRRRLQSPIVAENGDNLSPFRLLWFCCTTNPQ